MWWHCPWKRDYHIVKITQFIQKPASNNLLKLNFQEGDCDTACIKTIEYGHLGRHAFWTLGRQKGDRGGDHKAELRNEY